MVKYNRVSTTTTNSGILDDDDHHSLINDETESNDVQQGPLATATTKPLEIPLDEKIGREEHQSQKNPRYHRTKVTRRGSHASLGSNRSLSSNHHNESSDDESEIFRRRRRSRERSPLRGSYDEEEIIQSTSSMNSASRNDYRSVGGTGNNTPRSLSPKPVHPSVSTLNPGGSFDLDDDDDEEELHLKRYHLDFATTDRGDSLTRANASLHGSNNSMSFGMETSTYASSSSRRNSLFGFLWYAFQSARQQARQRRAQLLLQQTERNWQQSLKICILTFCDATDRGILLVVALLMIWIAALVIIQNPVSKRRVLLIGISLFFIRVGTRPLSEYCWRQRQKRRQSTMPQLISQDSPSAIRKNQWVGNGKLGILGKGTSSTHRLPYLDNESPNQSARHEAYAGSLELHPMNSQSGNDNDNSEMSRERPNPNEQDISPPSLYMTESNGSDPMIAAI